MYAVPVWSVSVSHFPPLMMRFSLTNDWLLTPAHLEAVHLSGSYSPVWKLFTCATDSFVWPRDGHDGDQLREAKESANANASANASRGTTPHPPSNS